MAELAFIAPGSPPDAFPPAQRAMDDPNGLLAAGGDLSAKRLLAAYSQGIFPWYDDNVPLLWWSPNPRAVFYPDRIHMSKRTRRYFRQNAVRVAIDNAFNTIVEECAAPGPGRESTWITEDMKQAYHELFALGYAHSIGIYRDHELIGGLFGISLGCAFIAESMFSRQSNGSKFALITLAALTHAWGYHIIDTQFLTPHLQSMGAIELPREHYLILLSEAIKKKPADRAWLELPPDHHIYQNQSNRG